MAGAGDPNGHVDVMKGRADSIDPEYLDTPYPTAAVNICGALGLFIGAWTVIPLLAAPRPEPPRSARDVQRVPQPRQIG